MFRVYATTPENLGPAAIAAHAQRAEAIGFDGLVLPDAVHDGLLLAALALNATTRLRVCIGVLVAFPRSPMNVALAAWDLQAMSAGRFELGLGTQVKANIEQRYSSTWSSPVPRMRDYIGALRTIFAAFQHGAALNFDSANYRFSRLQPFFNPGPIEHPHIPLLLGAVGPLMTKLAGEVGDGMITHPSNSSPRYVREVIAPRLQQGAHEAGRDLAAFHLLQGTLVATGPDAGSVRREREKWRSMLGFLFSTPAYWPSLELFGWAGRGEALRRMSRDNRWEQMNTLIDDAMLGCFVPSAPYAELAALLQRWYADIPGAISLGLPEDAQHDAALGVVLTQLHAAQ